MPPRLGPGPVFAHEWLRATRRWTHYAHRSLIVSLALFGLLTASSEDIFFGRSTSPENLARFGETFYRLIAVIELTAALLVAVWVNRSGHATALFIAAYVLIIHISPCAAGLIIAAFSRHHGLFALIGNPWLGTHLLTVGVAQAETVSSTGIELGELARGVLAWIPVNLGFAWLVFSDACFSFEESLGGIPEWRRRRHGR